ncbi:MAG: GtrA family protein [Chromatiaceae bacterium]
MRGNRGGKLGWVPAAFGLLDRLPSFALVGAIATAVQYLILFLLVDLAGSNPVLASGAGFVVSAFVNYFLNYRFTFRSTEQHRLALIRFMTVAGIGLSLNSAVMHTLIAGGVHYLFAQVFATGAVLLCTFAGHSIWTFGSSRARGMAAIRRFVREHRLR